MAENGTPTPPQSLSTEDIFKILAEQNQKFIEQWQEQAKMFANAIDKSAQSPKDSSKYNSIKLPKFSGEPEEDVIEFITNYDRAAKFHKWSDGRKAEALPLHLLGTASVWFNTTPDLAEKSYAGIVDALKRQFHSTADLWLLRQKLNDRRQLPTETVTTYAADIRRISGRINLPRSEMVNHFIQGLKPTLKSYVMLQQPQTIEEAETHAKLKESAPDPNSDKMDQVINLLTTQKQTPVVAAYSQANSTTQPQQNLPLSRDDVAQMVRQELRRANSGHRANNRGTPHRNQRSFDGRPICHYCGKVGHIASVCRKRLRENSDPRIPSNNHRPPYTNSYAKYSDQAPLNH